MRARAHCSGAALISAIFLIIVLAALGISMASLSNVEQDTASKSILSTKVYYGAKTGLEWAIWQTISDPAPPARCAGFPGPAFPLSGPGLAGVSVAVTCASSQHGAGTAVFTYHLTSTATIGSAPGTLGYAERHMIATVSNIP